MGIKSDRWIRRMAAQGMIEPFEAGQVKRNGDRPLVSYGTSSYGYDIRCSDEFKIFTNINSTIVDPKKFDEKSFVDFKGDICIIPPNSFALARTVEYLRIPRDVLVICLGKSTYARCFSGDTRVALVDGTSPSLEEMAARADSGEMFWGYSLSEHGRIIVTMLDAPRFIGRDALLEIILDNGEPIRCTPDHQFLLRDGRLAPAHALVPGSSLMPLYRQLVRGYEAIYQPLNGHIFPTHRLADEWNIRHGIYPDVLRTHRHHRDHDRRNNMPWNVTRMSAGEHIRHHNPESYGENFDPDAHGKSIRDAFERKMADPSWRTHFSNVQRKRAERFWNDEVYAQAREKLRFAQLATWTPERRASRSEASQRYYTDPTNRLAQGERRFPDVIAEVRGSVGRNHKVASIRQLPGDHDVYCLTVPEAGNFALEAGVFTLNCGIIVNVTPLEPEWEGHVTLEFSNTTPLPAKIYANEGVAQVLFLGAEEVCETSYRDRGGKYQGQKGVTLPKI